MDDWVNRRSKEKSNVSTLKLFVWICVCVRTSVCVCARVSASNIVLPRWRKKRIIIFGQHMALILFRIEQLNTRTFWSTFWEFVSKNENYKIIISSRQRILVPYTVCFCLFMQIDCICALATSFFSSSEFHIKSFMWQCLWWLNQSFLEFLPNFRSMNAFFSVQLVAHNRVVYTFDSSIIWFNNS